MAEVSRNPLLGPLLDGLLLVVTFAALAIAFWHEAPEWLPLSILATFVLLFFLHWKIAEDRKAYLKANWLDLVLVVLLSSPFLRLLVAFKLAGIAPLLRLGAFFRLNKKRLIQMLVLSSDSLPAAMTLIFGVVFLFGAGAYLLEHGVNPSFENISDGLWWAFVTLTTVGYGDIVPVTTAGRLLAVMTMIFGITLYSLMIANLTYFIEGIGGSAGSSADTENRHRKKLTVDGRDPMVRRPRKLRLKKTKA